jgi:hypothetical protein
MTGRKDDEGKPRKDDEGKPRIATLLPWGAVLEVVAVLEYGARKYAVDNWRGVPRARQRYADAAARHLIAWLRGEERDQESGLRHLAHAATCLLFLLVLEEEKKDEK